MRRLVKGLNKVGCAFFVALRWWVMLNCWNLKIVFFAMRPMGVAANAG